MFIHQINKSDFSADQYPFPGKSGVLIYITEYIGDRPSEAKVKSAFNLMHTITLDRDFEEAIEYFQHVIAKIIVVSYVRQENIVVCVPDDWDFGLSIPIVAATLLGFDCKQVAWKYPDVSDEVRKFETVLGSVLAEEVISEFSKKTKQIHKMFELYKIMFDHFARIHSGKGTDSQNEKLLREDFAANSWDLLKLMHTALTPDVELN